MHKLMLCATRVALHTLPQCNDHGKKKKKKRNEWKGRKGGREGGP